MMNLPWCWHRFSAWKMTGYGTLSERSIADPKQETLTVGAFIQQERTCERCGLIQIRRATVKR